MQIDGDRASNATGTYTKKKLLMIAGWYCLRTMNQSLINKFLRYPLVAKNNRIPLQNTLYIYNRLPGHCKSLT
jgi:hypothetical protein